MFGLRDPHSHTTFLLTLLSWFHHTAAHHTEPPTHPILRYVILPYPTPLPFPFPQSPPRHFPLCCCCPQNRACRLNICFIVLDDNVFVYNPPFPSLLFHWGTSFSIWPTFPFPFILLEGNASLYDPPFPSLPFYYCLLAAPRPSLSNHACSHPCISLSGFFSFHFYFRFISVVTHSLCIPIGSGFFFHFSLFTSFSVHCGC